MQANHINTAIKSATKKGYIGNDYDAAMEFLFNNQPKFSRLPIVYGNGNGGNCNFTLPTGHTNFVTASPSDLEIIQIRFKKYYVHVAQDLDGKVYRIVW